MRLLPLALGLALLGLLPAARVGAQDDDDANPAPRGDSSKLPPDLRVDVLPKLKTPVVPVYPFPFLVAGTTGKAEVALVVDEQGRVDASRVLSADRPEFGLALQAAAERFLYEPALKDGRPHRTLVGAGQDFETSDQTLVTDEDQRILRILQKHPERVSAAGSLDRRMRVLVSRQPVFPHSLVGQATRGEAVVEVLVDEAGHPCLPRVVSASAPEFGYAAAAALSLWIFVVPTAQGHPTIVRVQVPFVFKLESPPAPSPRPAPAAPPR
jgi:outer membrane biosynthesis protein TonB